MPNVDIHIEGLDKFTAALAKSPQIVARHMQRAIEKSGYIFLRDVKQNIRSGRDMYRPPLDTGYMWNNIFLNVSNLRADIVPTANYAIDVHDGTGRMRARPFLTITEMHSKKELEDSFADELNQALKEIANA